jgi:hypothetical protein
MNICIETNGGDVIIAGATSRIRLTFKEAAELGAALIKLTKPRTTTPAKARLMRYPIES